MRNLTRGASANCGAAQGTAITKSLRPFEAKIPGHPPD